MPFHTTLMLHDTALDLYIKRLQPAIASIPRGLINLEESCALVISDLIDVGERGIREIISLGHGYHFSDFEGENYRNRPTDGIILRINPPFPKEVKNINLPCYPPEKSGFLSTCPSFDIGENRFALTPKVYNLDNVRCDDLRTGEPYKKQVITPYVPDPNNPDACPF